jgi:hypothetical protein
VLVDRVADAVAGESGRVGDHIEIGNQIQDIVEKLDVSLVEESRVIVSHLLLLSPRIG